MNHFKIAVVSLGCPKNQVDAEIMLSALSRDGFIITTDAGEADLIIVNTCGFIEDAKKESIANIIDMAEYKKYGKLKALVVTGCLAERYRDEVIKEMPEVDLVVGIGSNKDISSLCREVLENKCNNSYGSKCDLPLSGERILSTPEYTAYLKIADGCNNRCTYCAIPMIRGDYRSRKIEDVVEEAKVLAKSGVKELVVIAQDTTYYGFDLYGKLMLPALLEELCKTPGIVWIRILYAYPDFITDELIEVMAREEKIAKYIDIPLQHANEQVLQNMNRRGNSKILLELVDQLRSKMPGIVIRTTFIVGFPKESDLDFKDLCDFVKKAKFERMGAFIYSPEEDTKAALMEDQIDEETKIKRYESLMGIQQEISEAYLKNQIGQTKRVLVEGYDGYVKKYFGRCEADAPDIDGKVFFDSSKKRSVGEFVYVFIKDSLDYDLLGICEA